MIQIFLVVNQDNSLLVTIMFEISNIRAVCFQILCYEMKEINPQRRGMVNERRRNGEKERLTKQERDTKIEIAREI